MERSNRAAAFKGIVVNPGEDIQLAIDSMFAVGGGVISLLAGTYYPKSNITLRPNCKLAGENGATTIIDFANQAYSIIIPGIEGTESQFFLLEGIIVPGVPLDDDMLTSNFRMESITVQNSSTHGIIFKKNTSSVFFSAVDSKYNGGDGFSMDYLSGAIFETCNAISNARHGFFMHHCSLINFTGASASVSNTGSGVWVSSSQHVRVHSLLSQFNTLMGIHLTISDRCSIRDTISIKNTGSGIELYSAEFNNITNTQIYENGGDGILIDSNSSRNSIVSSAITENGGWGVKINTVDCRKNLLAFDDLGSTANTSGTLSDAGTGTVSVNHIT